MRTLLLTCATVLLTAACFLPTEPSTPTPTFEESFEKAALGSFPTAWRDVHEITIPARTPTPSARIINTQGHDGNPTQALQFADAVTTSSGIYREVGVQTKYRFSADVRIDRWSNSSQAFFTDWAIAMGMMSLLPGVDMNSGPQVMFVAQPVKNNWVLYALRTDFNGYDFFNLEFDAEVKLDTWYHVTFELDTTTGKVATRVVEAATETVTLDTVTQIPKWKPEKSGLYTHFGAFDGEYNTDATTGNLATIDNIQFGQ